MKECKSCGTTNLSDEAKFCMECGKSFPRKTADLPYTFKTYLHGNREDDEAKETLLD